MAPAGAGGGGRGWRPAACRGLSLSVRRERGVLGEREIPVSFFLPGVYSKRCITVQNKNLLRIRIILNPEQVALVRGEPSLQKTPHIDVGLVDLPGAVHGADAKAHALLELCWLLSKKLGTSQQGFRNPA